MQSTRLYAMLAAGWAMANIASAQTTIVKVVASTTWKKLNNSMAKVLLRMAY